MPSPAPFRRLLPLLALLNAPVVLACSDDYCAPELTLTADQCGLTGLPFLAPENDTRVNLALLLAEQGKFPRPQLPAGYPTAEPFARHDILGAGLTPAWAEDSPPPPPVPAFLATLGIPDSRWQTAVVEREGSFTGSPCQSNSAVSTRLFLDQLEAARLPLTDARLLAGARLQLNGLCEGDSFPPLAGLPQEGIAGEFSRYLQAASAFYAGRYDEADTQFTALVSARQPWVAETARYLLIRVPLNAAQRRAVNDWGDLDLARADKPKLRLALTRTADYRHRYPQGRYAASANGLYRRIHWLLGDGEQLAARYAADFSPGNAVALLEELDDKIYVRQPELYVRAMPELWLVQALRALRADQPWMMSDQPRPRLTAAQLEQRLKQDFGRNPPPWAAYLQAAQQFYVAGNAPAALKATAGPLDGPAADVSGFSNRILHGLALTKLQRWDEAEAHWRALLAVETDRLRTPLLQLALAMTLERRNRLEAVFAPDSPVSNTLFRQPLLNVAPAPLLRQILGAPHLPLAEKQAAATRLLRKDLTRGLYADFGNDLALAAALGPNDFSAPSRALDNAGYACPALTDTVAVLRQTPAQARSLNCLADFFRAFTDHGYEPLRPDLLGGGPDRFPGRDRSSLDLYRAVISNSSAPDEDRAYALHRALRCFATSGNNHCDDSEVSKAQRKRWFTLLKTRYGRTVWGRAQRVYW